MNCSEGNLKLNHTSQGWTAPFTFDHLHCRFALAFTLYFPMMNIMAYYCHDFNTFRSFWFATVNSNNMWYCFLKAWCNVLIGKVTKKESGFKVSVHAIHLMHVPT